MKNWISLFLLICSSLLLMYCSTPNYKTTGSIERLDAELDQIISASARIEIIAEGFDWSEGPVWIPAQNMLLFTDVPRNTIYKWTEQAGSEVYLTPSGFTGSETPSREEGANGLALDNNEQLILCQHGDRRLAKMEAPLDQPSAAFITLADRYEDRRFNSPNDLAIYQGQYYFTDPPYGLAQQMDDPEKEIPFQGVYRVNDSGEVNLLVDSLTRPNGIAFTPDGKLIIANSDPQKALWYEYTLDENEIISGRILFDATNWVSSRKGLPDGLKIDSRGYIYATGPGGVFILNPAGKQIGLIQLEEATSNCALSPDEKTLYITNDMYLVRVTLRN
jgi:gluconolactonase